MDVVTMSQADVDRAYASMVESLETNLYRFVQVEADAAGQWQRERRHRTKSLSTQMSHFRRAIFGPQETSELVGLDPDVSWKKWS